MDAYTLYIKNPATGEWEGIPALRGEAGDNGTGDYTALQNKPSINGIELNGNKTTQQLGMEIDLSAYRTAAAQDVIDSTKQSTLSAGFGISIADDEISVDLTAWDGGSY